MNSFENILGDSRVLWRMLRGRPGNGGETHSAALQRFYAPQAARYDHFRERLLHGREELMARLAPQPGGVLVDLGGGTGRNLEFLGPRMLSLARVEVVDLCPALLEVARARCARWPEVAEAIEADAASHQPARRADCVVFSYSLSMMPDWRRALDNALAMLRPGGLIGVVDFHVSPRHGALQRAFWPRWFAHDGVHLSPERLRTLQERTEPVFLAERHGRVPYLPGLRAPYYLYIGRRQ